MLNNCPIIEFNMGLVDTETLDSSQNIFLKLDDLTYKCESYLQLIFIIKIQALYLFFKMF
jgi:hypothetical protein